MFDLQREGSLHGLSWGNLLVVKNDLVWVEIVFLAIGANEVP